MEREPTTTEQMVFAMITENTGTHFLDSGGAYGRHWQRNQKIPIQNWIAREKVTMRPTSSRSGGWFGVTINLFHHLVDNLEYDDYLDRLFRRFVDLYEDNFYYSNEWSNRNFSWHKAMSAFHELIVTHHRGNRKYNNWEFEGDSTGGYTYNSENNLSQDFVYDIMGGYVFIRTHNGCDARGGFSYPHLFAMKDEWGILDYSRYTIYCEGEDTHWWDFDGGYESSEQEIELGKCEWVDYDDIEQEDPDRQLEIEEEYRLVLASWEKQIPFNGIDNPRPTPPENCFIGKILLKDGEAHCPICGSRLSVSAW